MKKRERWIEYATPSNQNLILDGDSTRATHQKKIEVEKREMQATKQKVYRP